MDCTGEQAFRGRPRLLRQGDAGEVAESGGGGGEQDGGGGEAPLPEAGGGHRTH